LIDKTYLLNPDNLPIVNHIDGDIHNNRVSNLERISCSRSMEHDREKVIFKPYTRKVCQMDDNGDVIKVFDSVKEAAYSVNSSGSDITSVCKGSYISNVYSGRYKKRMGLNGDTLIKFPYAIIQCSLKD